jgi:hypothetical protein
MQREFHVGLDVAPEQQAALGGSGIGGLALGSVSATARSTQVACGVAVNHKKSCDLPGHTSK